MLSGMNNALGDEQKWSYYISNGRKKVHLNAHGFGMGFSGTSGCDGQMFTYIWPYIPYIYSHFGMSTRQCLND